MRRTIATLGIVGLGLMTATVSANAAPKDDKDEKKVTICHATSAAGNAFVSETINLSALKAHTRDTLDVVPPNEGDVFPDGQNWTAGSLAFVKNNCAAVVVPPVVTPDPDPTEDPTPDPDPTESPVEEEETPGADVTPEAAAPAAAGAVVAPKAAAVAAPKAAAVAAPKAAAAAAKKTNVGYNVQTAVGQTSGTGIPVWLMALTGVLTAGAATVVWQGGRRARSTDN